MRLFIKSKYTRRWRGKDGKYNYEYAKPKTGRTKAVDEFRSSYRKVKRARGSDNTEVRSYGGQLWSARELGILALWSTGKNVKPVRDIVRKMLDEGNTVKDTVKYSNTYNAKFYTPANFLSAGTLLDKLKKESFGTLFRGTQNERWLRAGVGSVVPIALASFSKSRKSAGSFGNVMLELDCSGVAMPAIDIDQMAQEIDDDDHGVNPDADEIAEFGGPEHEVMVRVQGLEIVRSVSVESDLWEDAHVVTVRPVLAKVVKSMEIESDEDSLMEELYHDFDTQLHERARLVVKSKRMPIGTISHGRKKIAEGRWVPVPKGRPMRSLANEHDIKQIREMFKRQPPGEGGPKKIESEHDLELILSKTTFCMISAGRNRNVPADMKMSDAQIKARDKKLKADLVKSGYMFTPAIGKYGDLEDSVLVMAHDANRKEMMSLGKKYNQSTVLLVSKGHNELIHTTGPEAGKPDMTGDGHEYVPDAEDYYTEMQIASKKIRFSMVLEALKSMARLVVRLMKGRK